MTPLSIPRSIRRLGATQLEVSAIGMGCMQMAGRGAVERYYRSGLGLDSATRIVRAALAAGITWFDTARRYGNGQADHTLATALANTPPDALFGSDEGTARVTIATKWWPVARRAASISQGIDPVLRALSCSILHQIHWPVGSLSSMSAQLRALARLRNQGVVEAVGVSNFSAAQLRKAHAVLASEGVALATNQVQVSLLDRRIETNGVLETAQELGVTLISYWPLRSGILTGRFHDHPDQITQLSRMRRIGSRLTRDTLDRTADLITTLRHIGERHAVSAGQVALSWLITHYDNLVAIPGASTPRQAAENAAAMTVQLTPEDLFRLAEITTRYRRS